MKIYIVLIAVLLIALPIWYCIGASGSDMYVIDKGLTLSYIDEYGFVHDTVYWLVVADGANIFTVFTTGKTWHMYAVGELYTGPMERYTPSLTPTPAIDKNYATS
jgi:hypothetical protein